MKGSVPVTLACVGLLAAPWAFGSSEPVPLLGAEPEFATPTTLDRIGRIVIPVTINGQGPFRLMVDTGANRTVITTKVAERLGISYLDAPRVSMNGVTGEASVPAVTLDEVKAGDMVFETLNVPVLAPELIGDFDGILGVAGLKSRRLIVDFRRDTVTISRSRFTRPDGARIKVERVVGGLLSAPARIGGVEVLVIFDTGAQLSMGNRALQNVLRADPVLEAEVFGTTEHVATGEVANLPRIFVGKVEIRLAQVTFGDFHIFDVWGLNDRPAMIVGMDILGALDNFTIDFRLAEIHLRQ